MKNHLKCCNLKLRIVSIFNHALICIKFFSYGEPLYNSKRSFRTREWSENFFIVEEKKKKVTSNPAIY